MKRITTHIIQYWKQVKGFAIVSIFIFQFCTVQLGYSQNLGLDWVVQDGGTGTETVSKVITDQYGNAIVYGSFMGTVDFDPDPGTSYFLSSNGGKDMFVQKLDLNGQLLWVHSFGSTGDDAIYGMCLDTQENILITGMHWNTVDFDPGPGVANISSTGFESAFTLKLDPNGNFIWVIQNAVGSGLSVAQGVICDGSDNVYVTGQYRSNVDLDPDPGNTLTVSSNGYRDVFVQKLSSTGGLIWAQHFGGSYDDIGYNIQLDPNNYDVIVQGTYKNTVDFDPGAGVSNLTSSGNADIFFEKFDNNGTFIWAKSFGGSNDDYASDMEIDADGKIYLGGWFSGTVDFDPGAGALSVTSAGSYDGFVASFDDVGGILWLNTIGDLGQERIVGIHLDVTNNLYYTGSFENTVDFDPSAGIDIKTSLGSADIFIQKVVSTTGAYLWTETLGGSDSDVGFSVTTDVNDKLYLTGRFGTTVDFDPETSVYNLTTAGGYDGFVEKFGAGSGVSLPVELMNFNVWRLDNEEAKIQWNTFSEINNKEFLVERSKDGLNFTPIGIIQGAGNSNVILEYEFIDHDASSTIEWFYRIRQIDFNGDYSFSGVKVLPKIVEDGIRIYPNPVEDVLYLQFSDEKFDDQDAKWLIYNSLGQIIYNSGIQSPLQALDVKKLTKGIYFVEFQTTENRIVEKVVVK